MQEKLITDDAPDKRGILKFISAFIVALQRWIRFIPEPRFLFPAIAVVALAAIWGIPLKLINDERAAAERAAAVASRELAGTYEAQVIRALREIDQTLKVVKYAIDVWGEQDVLNNLKARGLLPPDLLFVISVADSKCDIVASTSPIEMTNVASHHFFQSQRQTDAFAVGRPHLSPGTGEWKLEFSRRLDAAGGKFAGIVLLSVDAAYFVSG
jgi:hypothetical protein